MLFGPMLIYIIKLLFLLIDMKSQVSGCLHFIPEWSRIITTSTAVQLENCEGLLPFMTATVGGEILSVHLHRSRMMMLVRVNFWSFIDWTSRAIEFKFRRAYNTNPWHLGTFPQIIPLYLPCCDLIWAAPDGVAMLFKKMIYVALA